MKLHRVQQGSLDWYRLRIGRPTSSEFHRIVTPKGALSSQASKYLYRLVAERLLNESMEDQIGHVRWVEWGKGQEGNAVANFQLVNDVTEGDIELGGFVTTDDGRLGASPDRLFKGHRESMEVKCPSPPTQMRYLLEGPEDDYRPQVQGHLLVGEFQAVHFYSWHPQMPSFHKITLPDRAYMDTLTAALKMFCDAVDMATARARALGAYAVVQRAETPADAAYGPEQPKAVSDG